MEREIETRFLEIDKDALIQKLVELGAVDCGEERLDETIFHAADGSWVGKRKFVRLRKSKNKITLAYKENREQTIDSTREIEFEVSDTAKCSEFLEKLGLGAMRTVEKYRHTFTFGDVTLDIDTWPKIPPYVEIEGPTVGRVKEVGEKLEFDCNKRFDGDARQVFRSYDYDIDKLSVILFNKFE